MARILGKNCDFAIDTTTDATSLPVPFFFPVGTNADANMVRIETVSNEVSLNIQTQSVDTSAYGDDFDQFAVTTYNWSVDISAYVDNGSPNSESIFVGTTSTGILGLKKYKFALAPSGRPDNTNQASNTQPKYSGRVLLESVSVSPARAGVSMLKIKLKGDGQLHRSVNGGGD